jgi:hypothetical protein
VAARAAWKIAFSVERVALRIWLVQPVTRCGACGQEQGGSQIPMARREL